MGKNIPPLIGDRLSLQLATEADAKAVLDALPEVPAENLQAFARGRPTLEEERAYLRGMDESPTDYLFLVRTKMDGRVIGTIGLHEYDETHDTARLALHIFREEARRRGYGSEAIKLLLRFAFLVRGVNKVYGKFFVENKKNRPLFTRLGFREEGVLREEYKLRGVYHDMIYISMLRRDYDALVAREKERTE